MKNEITAFKFDNHDVRVITKEGNPWWVLSDVCSVLGLTNSRMVSDRLEDDEKGVSQIYTLGGPQKAAIVNESGLYSVILRSDKPEAKRFRKWVTSEVLPSIRKTGGYGAAAHRLPSGAQLHEMRLTLGKYETGRRIDFLIGYHNGRDILGQEKSVNAPDRPALPAPEFRNLTLDEGITAIDTLGRVTMKCELLQTTLCLSDDELADALILVNWKPQSIYTVSEAKKIWRYYHAARESAIQNKIKAWKDAHPVLPAKVTR